MRGTFGACFMALCLVFQCSGSPMITPKRAGWSTTSSTEVPVTNRLSVSLLEIFKNDNNSTPKESAARNHSLENLFVTLKKRIHSYRDPKKAYDINHPALFQHPAVNRLLTLKDKNHRYVVVTKKTPHTNQSSESSIVTHKNQSEGTSTAPDDNFSESPFVTFKYEDYHSRTKEASKKGVHFRRNSLLPLMNQLQFFLNQFQALDFENVINEYVKTHIDF